ncbi:MAG: hypothetical protein ACE361_15705 [Aureliella sp.]
MTFEPVTDIQRLVERIDFADKEAAQQCLLRIADLNVPSELFRSFLGQLADVLPSVASGDQVVGRLERFLEACRSPLSWLGLFEREPDSLPILLRLFATSEYLSGTLIRDPEAFDLLRMTDGQPVEKSLLKDEILAAVASAGDTKARAKLLRDYRHREMLRIAYSDFIRGLPVDTVISQISGLADCLIEAAVVAAQLDLKNSGKSLPLQPDGQPVDFAVLALGKLGASELNYSSDVDLLFLRDDLKPTPAWDKPRTTESAVQEFMQRLAQKTIKLLTDSMPEGIVYRVDMRLRPHGKSGPLVTSYQDGVGYYDSVGRTWERQAFIKARCIAGDHDLGEQFIAELQPWIYRRYLMRADITGLVALKRRIEHSAWQPKSLAANAAKSSSSVGSIPQSDSTAASLPESVDPTTASNPTAFGYDVKRGYGGIRDIEASIQFLQLLHGAEHPEVRVGSTLEAIRQLEVGGCLMAGERTILEENYRYLRRLEHCLQIHSDRQVFHLPIDHDELEDFVHRVASAENGISVDEFSADLARRTAKNRQVLEHLLHNAFDSHDHGEDELAFAESDLVLDPEPDVESIHSTLAPYGFHDSQAAFRNLQDMARESVPFLSTRRSRHFLAAIAPKLLPAVARTPNPDRTLTSLANVSESLGGKAVLWELFSSNPPSMDLCLRLCATSPYLSGILTGNPGMIDELLDSLMLGSLPTHDELAHNLDTLCQGASDIAPILYSFKNSMHLRVGVHDILGKSSIEETHQALSDIAEVCMEQVIRNEFHRLVQKLGMPTKRVDSKGEKKSQKVDPAELVVLAVGKLGGREPNYHSDIDLVFLFDEEGQTSSLTPNRRFEPTTNRHFFNELCGRVIYAATHSGTTGRLFDLDARLRPLGRAGELAISFQDLENYFAEGAGQIWERQALCKARPIWGSAVARQRAMETVSRIMVTRPWESSFADAIYEHRMALEKDASDVNLKRGVGGTMDIEFIVQMLQLAHAERLPAIRVPGTLDAIQSLAAADALEPAIAEQLTADYQFLRSIESAIRLMNLTARHELPSDGESLEQLAFLLSASGKIEAEAADLRGYCDEVRGRCRAAFETIFAEYRTSEETD